MPGRMYIRNNSVLRKTAGLGCSLSATLQVKWKLVQELKQKAEWLLFRKVAIQLFLCDNKSSSNLLTLSSLEVVT